MQFSEGSELHFLHPILAAWCNTAENRISCTPSLQCSALRSRSCISCTQSKQGSSRLHFLHPIRAEQIAVAFPAPNPCRAAWNCISGAASLQCNSERAQSCISCTQSVQSSSGLHFLHCIRAVQFGEGSELHFLHPISAGQLRIAFPALHPCSAIQDCISCAASVQCNSVRAQSCISCTQSGQGSSGLHFLRCILAVQFGEGSELHFLHPIRAEQLMVAFPALHPCSAIW